MREIKNAIIRSVSIDYDDHGVLTAWLHLDYGSSKQGFGGYCLYIPKEQCNSGDFKMKSFCGHFIFRCMQVCHVLEWNLLCGKPIRAAVEDGLVKAIGHFINDEWFDPSKEFNENGGDAQ